VAIVLLPVVMVVALVGAAHGSRKTRKPMVTVLVAWLAFYSAGRIGDRTFADGELEPFAAALLPLAVALVLAGVSNWVWRPTQ